MKRWATITALTFALGCSGGENAREDAKETERGVAKDGEIELEAKVEQCGPPRLPEELEACSDASLAGLGATPEMPFEWGPGGAVGPIFGFDLLSCEDGSIPVAFRTGNIGEAPKQSTSYTPHEEPFDILDAWQVFCPGMDAPATVYQNMYRCGPKCAPANTQWLDMRALGLVFEGRKMLNEGSELPRVLEMGLQAHELIPKHEHPIWLVSATYDALSQQGERVAFLTKAGDGDNGAGCFILADTQTGPVRKETLGRGCALGYADSCSLGAAARLEDGDDVAETMVMSRRGCELGSGLGCTVTAAIARSKMGASMEEVMEWLQKACGFGEQEACGYVQELREQQLQEDTEQLDL